MKIPTRFPTIVGILLVIVILGAVIFVEQMVRSPSGASGSQEPTNIRQTNVTDSSFTFSWTTQVPTLGTMLVSSPGKNNQIYYDERDNAKKIGTYITHSITVNDARPSTNYTIKIIPNEKSYTIRTPDSLPPNTKGLEPAYGTIREASDRASDGALVYLVLEGGQELSTLTKPSGLWLIPLNQVRSADLTSYLPTLERMTETIVVNYNNLETSAITDTLNDSPVPEMTLGKTYDFRRQQAKTTGNTALALRSLNATPTLPLNSTVLGENIARSFSVALVSPAQGASLSTTRPLIQGKGYPNKFVGISVGITQPLSGSVRVGSDGLWSFTPPKSLSPGKQSVTISTIDGTGKTVAITHSFDILKSGTQVLGDATPSATLEPTETPLDVPTSTLSGDPPPDSGNELLTIILLLVGIGLFAGGTVIVGM